MKCSICKRDLGKEYNGAIYKINNKYICEDCAEKIAKQGGFVKLTTKEEVNQKPEQVQNKEETEKEKKKKEYEERMKELQEKYKDIL